MITFMAKIFLPAKVSEEVGYIAWNLDTAGVQMHTFSFKILEQQPSIA